MTDVAALLRAPMDLVQTLNQILAGALEAVPGIDQASISMITADGIETLAPTDPRVTQADQIQYQLKQGPCLEAALATDLVVQVDDLATDLRWPDYGPKAAALGFGAQIAFQFRAASSG